MLVIIIVESTEKSMGEPSEDFMPYPWNLLFCLLWDTIYVIRKTVSESETMMQIFLLRDYTT